MIKLAKIYHQRLASLKLSSGISSFEGYKLISSNYSEDFKIQINELVHQQTGAKIYHFQRNDEDNTFATIFKTFPSDSKGTPHILQHLACCGSEKYPIRDPFFNMLKRSVNTYMNAWTGEDFTCYPFSSANPKDWNNLFGVYTDMSFRPLLNELDFMQQGWRYEINQNGEKQIKGIVFNQMKGAYQSAQRQLMVALNQALYSGTGYRHDSGGKPEQIVNLTYQQLRDMHSYFYHPSNMSVFLYGNQKVEPVLKQLNETYLKGYSKQDKYNHGQKIAPELPKQHFKTIKSRTAETNSISLFFYIKNIEQINPVESLCFKILQYMILEKNTSNVYENFIQTGKAENIGHSGFNESKLSSFGVTLKGINPLYQPEAFHKEIVEMLEGICDNGINEKKLGEFLHELQIGIKTPKQNYGIKLLQDCINYMNHRLQLISYLSPLKYIPYAKETLLNKDKLKSFIQKNFLDNQHFVVIKQVVEQPQNNEPQPQTSTAEHKIQSSISISEQEIKSKQQQLKERQSLVQDINVLPKLNLQDLIARKKLTPEVIQDYVLGNRKVRYFQVPIENEIHFYRFVFNFKNIDFNINDKLSLWNFLLNKGISTKTSNYKELSSRMGEFTAGFYAGTSFGASGSVNVVLGISCLKRNREQLFKLIEQIIFEPVFEEENISNLYRAFQNDAIETLTDTPIAQCLDECGSMLNINARLFNKYQKIKSGLQNVREQNIQSMKEISEFLLASENVFLIEHSNEKPSKLPQLFQRFQNHAVRNYQQSTQYQVNFGSKAVTHNFDVNFCTQQYKGPQYLSKQHAQMCILSQYLEQQYLHPEIREKGGAYGARSSVRESGNISLYSYMDPQGTKTFKVFDESVEKIKCLDKIPEQQLTQIKITLLGEMQRIKIPQEQCVNGILKEYSIKDYQQFLEYVKSAQSQSIIQSSRKYLNAKEKARCVFGKQVPEGFSQERLSSFI